MTEDGQSSSVLSICKPIPQKWKLRHVRRRVFRPSAAENVEWIRRGAADVVICRTHDKLRAGRALTELPNHEMIAKLRVVEQHIIPFKPRRVDRVVIISVVADRDIRRADDVLLEYSSPLCLFWLLFITKFVSTTPRRITPCLRTTRYPRCRKNGFAVIKACVVTVFLSAKRSNSSQIADAMPCL